MDNAKNKKIKTVVFLIFAIIIIGSLVLMTRQRNSEWKDEENFWRKEVKSSPNKARPHNNLGCILSGKKKYDEAIIEYEAAIKIYPDYEDAIYNLGTVYMDTKKYELAKGYFIKVLTLNPDYAEAHNNLGMCFAMLGDYRVAASEFSKCVALKPSYEIANRNLQLAILNMTGSNTKEKPNNAKDHTGTK